MRAAKHRVADRLRSAVAASNLELQRTTFGLSMTVGSARFNHRDPELLEVLMHRAEPGDPQTDGIVGTGRRSATRPPGAAS